MTVVENSKLELPVGAKVLSIEAIDNELYANVLIDQMMNRRTIYEFKIFSANQGIESLKGFTFKASCRLKIGMLHIFEREKGQD